MKTGKKVGRNDECPCGSGKKYKKCCLRGPRHVTPIPLTNEEIRYDEIVNGGRDERIQLMRDVVQIVFDRSRNRASWNADDAGSTARLDALRTEITIDEIARRASEILNSCPHSRQYWYQLVRRFAPLLWEELLTISKFDGSPDWFAEVTKGAGELVLAYSANGDPWEWTEEGGTRGIDYRGLSRQELRVAAQVFSLAQLRYEAQVRFRFACKGFRVFAQGNEDDALSAQDTESINRYEERREKYDTFAGSAGLWCDPVEIAPARKDLCLWVGLRTAVTNHLVLRSQTPTVEIPLQYFFSPFFEATASSHVQAIAKNELGNAASLVAYDRLIEHPALRPTFQSAFGFESGQIVAFLYSVFRLIYTFLRFPRLHFGNEKTIALVWDDEPDSLREKVLHHWRDAGTLGLLRSEKQDWIERLQIEAAHVHDSDDSVAELDNWQVEELVEKFTWKGGTPIYGNRPLLFTEVSSRTLILDGFVVGDFLRHILLAANVVSKDESRPTREGDVTGRWLERQAASYFARELGLPASRVIQGREVKKTREIDIAFVFGRTLFVFDCKAMAKDAAFIEGRHQRIRNRQTEMRKELKEKNPQRIELIKQGLVRDAIAPESFDQSYGLVCTSAVEYLPIEDEVFWSNGIPLVGPPEELLNSIRLLASR